MNLKQEYNKIRKQLLNKNYRLRKAGKPQIKLPKIPKKVTQGSINKLSRLKNQSIKKYKPKSFAKPYTPPAGAIKAPQLLCEQFFGLLNRITSACNDNNAYSPSVTWAPLCIKLKSELQEALILEADPKKLQSNFEYYQKIYNQFEPEIIDLLLRYHDDIGNDSIMYKVISICNKYLETDIIVTFSKGLQLDLATGEYME